MDTSAEIRLAALIQGAFRAIMTISGVGTPTSASWGRCSPGEGEAAISPVTSLYDYNMGLIHGGWSDPFYGPKFLWNGLVGTWSDVTSMVDGNAIAAGHIAGGIGVILLSDGLAKGAFKGAGEVKACFVAGTLVLLADGYAKPIEQIKAGDKVLTRSQASDERAATYGGIVADVYRLHHNGTLRLNFATGGSVEATPSHPFFVISKGFTAAEDLQVGDRIAESDTEKTDAITRIVRISGDRPVYNLNVGNDHTYFVRTTDGTWLWVHN